MTEAQQRTIFTALIIGGIIWSVSKIRIGTEAVANPIADAWLWLTQPGQVQILAQIVLPDGRVIPANSIALDSKAQFVYQNVRYQLTGRNDLNQYVAVRL